MPVNLVSAGGGTTTLTAASSASNFTLTLPAYTGTILTNKTPGTVLQVVQTSKIDTTASVVTANTWNEFDTTFRVTITPSAATSKILLTASISGAQTTGTVRYKFQYSTDGGTTFSDVSPIPAASGSHSSGHFGYAVNSDTNQVVTCGMELLHSPATTNTIIYRIQYGQDVSTTYYFNRSIAYPNSFLGGTYTSIYVAKEIAG